MHKRSRYDLSLFPCSWKYIVADVFLQTAVHYAFHLLVRVRQRKSKKGKLVWNGAEGFDLDDWPSPPPDGNIEAQVEWRGERVQVWRPDWSNKKKCVFHIMTLFATRHAGMLDSAFRTSVILPKCREYNIIQRAVSASLLVPMLYDHIDSKFKSDPVLQGGEDMGTEAGYQLFPILKSLSDLRKRPDDQCWAYEEQPWWSDIVLKLEYQKRESDYGDVPHPGISSIHLAFSVGVCVRGT
ncbi:hypothetical protein I305_04762 [Cryptococcus gattii E566]|uniref:Uncharacterized protein n=1 Tax=Cryptococcus gattii serotype B (strain WM276 / ATCC MYA-4071) TaxID=367775 RepID=E6RG76_CRYGW|nr:Hypothetical Protein CGB_N2480W [Cryptococcus gattii WM276]ADV25767.1 Hypothetical Protein CGB_N2480W [Cryptococcus gattii WM276]KIY32608.1 hypothetical protein I305_04762 [Cryptococcus gattii E566]KJE01546.1 hypothetical protein I311_04833 [Cryptococcus gattii NT-10]